MRPRWRLVLAGIVIVGAALGGYLGTASRDSLKHNAPIPEGAITQFFATRLNDSDGKPQPISQWQGKTLVINFWATWCPPCREEMPAFSRLQAKYAANGTQFVGIALDTPDNVSAFLRQVSVSYPLLLAESEGMDLAQRLGNSRLALPYTLVLGADGKPLLVRLGKLPEQELDALLRKITLVKSSH